MFQPLFRNWPSFAWFCLFRLNLWGLWCNPCNLSREPTHTSKSHFSGYLYPSCFSKWGPGTFETSSSQSEYVYICFVDFLSWLSRWSGFVPKWCCSRNPRFQCRSSNNCFAHRCMKFEQPFLRLYFEAWCWCRRGLSGHFGRLWDQCWFVWRSPLSRRLHRQSNLGRSWSQPANFDFKFVLEVDWWPFSKAYFASLILKPGIARSSFLTPCYLPCSTTF